MEITFVDRQGRLYLPKKLREEIGIKEGAVLRLRRENKKIVLEQTKGIARAARGIFKLKTRIEDVDKLIEKYSYEEVARELKK
jgi:AbrB family looped-hinge helix DNA binding protein